MKFEHDLGIRYFLIFLVSLFGGYLYLVLLPATIWPVSFALKWFYDLSIQGNTLFIAGKSIELVRACVGAAAIALLLVLNLSTPSMAVKKRLKVFASGLGLFLIFNWLRIIALSILFVNEISSFNQIHILTWYFVSTIALAGIWILSVNIFKIKDVPFLSDLKELSNQLKK